MWHGPHPLRDRRQSISPQPLAVLHLCGSWQALLITCRCGHLKALMLLKVSKHIIFTHFASGFQGAAHGRTALIPSPCLRNGACMEASLLADACTVTTTSVLVMAWHVQGFPEQYMQSIFDRCAHALQVSSAADLQHAANVCQIEWSASGTWLAVATEDGRMSLWRQNLLGSWKLVSSSSCVDPGSLAMVD